MTFLETLMFEVSKLFLMPVLVILAIMFTVALLYLGAFLAELAARMTGRAGSRPLFRFRAANPAASRDALELHLLRRLEPLRVVSRVAPMLGLVATMIPMGPALVAVSQGDTAGIAENLVIAFAAVIIALLAAAITYTVLSVRRRWLLEELDALLSAPTEGAAHG
ncbi:MotA/TolQ/ExbB proton channel family protein [Thalassovita aquimarina]|uniref:MotA/TolQ/ExbB proton channel family protein n=1 Tax=Thalassovita aquimarina TaxID=2785917 RepID=A0ABS5HQN6_9RHOB|nr:MotA/TolQ/ExbB proton channel family protein [Thalassovita aquimarina]MBR9651294.1 MotA/TolQ/ExbB proton channel family protein [Thalassovita aquimarina]